MSATFKDRLKDKLPDLVLEICCIVIAVLLALAIDAWRDERQMRSQANALLLSLQTEANNNLAEINATLKDVDESRLMLKEKLASPNPKSRLNIGFALALTSSANWQTAQQSEGFQGIDLATRAQWAQLYQLQTWVDEAQRQAFIAMGELSDLPEGESPEQAMRKMLRELEFFSNIGHKLAQGLESTQRERPKSK
jgi:hypothetical protein